MKSCGFNHKRNELKGWAGKSGHCKTTPMLQGKSRGHVLLRTVYMKENCSHSIDGYQSLSRPGHSPPLFPDLCASNKFVVAYTPVLSMSLPWCLSNGTAPDLEECSMICIEQLRISLGSVSNTQFLTSRATWSCGAWHCARRIAQPIWKLPVCPSASMLTDHQW